MKFWISLPMDFLYFIFLWNWIGGFFIDSHPPLFQFLINQGTAACSAKIFLWNYYDRIVISDIDGTITKSDVMGQILPLVGRDWSQSGVTELFTNIEKNGYRFMYLSARAIGQVCMLWMNFWAPCWQVKALVQALVGT